MASLIDMDFRTQYFISHTSRVDMYILYRQPLLNQAIIAKGNIIEGIEAKE